MKNSLTKCKCLFEVNTKCTFITKSTKSVHLRNAEFLRKSCIFVHVVHSVGCDGQSLPWIWDLTGSGLPKKQIIYNLPMAKQAKLEAELAKLK